MLGGGILIYSVRIRQKETPYCDYCRFIRLDLNGVSLAPRRPLALHLGKQLPALDRQKLGRW